MGNKTMDEIAWKQIDMVASTKGTNKLCERRSTTWSGFCGVSKHCDQQCREWEKAAHGACHRQGLGMAYRAASRLDFHKDNHQGRSGCVVQIGSICLVGCGYGDETVQVQDGEVVVMVTCYGDGGDGEVMVMVMSYDGEVMRRFRSWRWFGVGVVSQNVGYSLYDILI
ncbi:putative gamma-thionin [Tanacetum coccineum]